MRAVRTVMNRPAKRLGSTRRSSLYLAPAVPTLGLAVTGVIPPRLGFLLALSLAIVGGGHLVAELRREVARRREADRLPFCEEWLA